MGDILYITLYHIDADELFSIGMLYVWNISRVPYTAGLPEAFFFSHPFKCVVVRTISSSFLFFFKKNATNLFQMIALKGIRPMWLVFLLRIVDFLCNPLPNPKFGTKMSISLYIYLCDVILFKDNIERDWHWYHVWFSSTHSICVWWDGGSLYDAGQRFIDRYITCGKKRRQNERGYYIPLWACRPALISCPRRTVVHTQSIYNQHQSYMIWYYPRHSDGK